MDRAHRKMKKNEKLLMIQSGLVLGITFMYLLGQFIHLPQMQYITGAYLMFVMLFFLPIIDGLIKYMSIGMLAIGSIIFILKGSSIDVWMSSASLNHTLISLFVSVPLLGLTVKSEEYLLALKGLYIKYLHSPSLFLASTQLFTHAMSVVLNMGAVSIFYYLSSKNPVLRSPRLISTTLLRGYASTITWSPFFAAMALVIGQLHIEWAAALPYLLGCVLISFAISILTDMIVMKREATVTGAVQEHAAGATVAEDEAMNVNWKKITELFLLLAGMIGLVFLIDWLTPLTMPTAVIILAFLLPPIWLAIKRQILLLLAESKHYVTTTVPLFKKETVLFLATGFFSGAVSQTNFGTWLAKVLLTVFKDFTIGISFFIAVTIIAFSIIGFHPIMLISLYITSVDPAMLGMSKLYYAVLLLGAWGLATTVSPMTAVSHMLGNLMKQRVFELSFNWNIFYCLISLCFLILYLTILAVFQVI